MRVPTKLRRQGILMQIEVKTLSPTSTYQPIIHQHSGTMRIFLMEEEHNKVKDLGRTFKKIMLSLGSNNNKNNNKEVRE